MSGHKLLPWLIVLALLLVAIPSFLAPQPVMAMTAEFVADMDTYIRADEPTTTHDDDGIRVGVVASDGTMRGIVQFSVNWGVDIPSDATIIEATLTLDASTSSGDAMTILVQRLRRLDCSETYATWQQYKSGSNWGTYGAASTTTDYTTTDQASAYYPGSGLDPIEWDVTNIVDRAMSYDEDVAFRIVAQSETAYEFIGFDDHEPDDPDPLLTITYCIEPDPTYAPTVSTGSYSDVTNTTAELYGSVTYVDNGLAVLEGFEWGLDQAPLTDSGGLVTWGVTKAGTSKAEIDEAQHYAGTRSAWLYRDGTNDVAATFSHTALASTETLAWYLRKDTNANIGIYHGNGAYYIYVGIGADEQIVYYDGTTHYTGSYVTVTTWQDFAICDVNWSSHTYDIYFDDCMIVDGATMATGGTNPNQVRFKSQSNTASAWLDNIGFRPYVLTRGFQYGLTQTPTWSVSESGLYSTGAYNLGIDSLSPGTEYWYRAYVSNAEGTAYGTWSAFTTLDVPAITTLDASNVASTSARLNSSLTSDGGGPCTIKFGWGLTSQSHVEDYDTYETLPGTYTSGNYPYLEVDGLVAGHTYYFRVSATNEAGTTEGSQLTFETEITLDAPTNLIGFPEATSISLSWSKGTGSSNTLVRYGTNSFPTMPTAGTQAYFGPGSTYTINDLTSGKTYWISAWGESGGNYSANYATLVMTTSAAAGDATDDIDVPTEPSRWLSAPDYTGMAGLSVLYDAFNALADTAEIPRETAWFGLALGLAFIASLLAYLRLGKRLLIAMIVMTVCLAIGYFVKLIPWWLPLMTLILVIVWNQTHKQATEG